MIDKPLRTGWPWRWWRPRLERLLPAVDPADVTRARGQIKDQPPPTIPAYGNTEDHLEWIVLRMHATRGQIDPAILRRMRWDDLQYLAGAQLPHPTTMATGSDDQIAQEIKVIENAVRAEREIERRIAQRSALWITLIAAAVGGGVAAIATAALT